MPRSRISSGCLCALLASLAASGDAAWGSDPFADTLIDYEAGSNPVSGFDAPSTVLGSPERFSGEGLFESVVSVFSGPFMPHEIVSIGAGGWLTVEFDEPVTDDPANPWGVDLLIFGNAFFIDDDFPNGVVGGLFGSAVGVVEVSEDGRRWVTVRGASAVGLYPTQGWLDAGPYDATPGSVPTDFTLPVNPSLTLRDFLGTSLESVLSLYAGSGGGTGIDLADAGVTSCRFVRVSLPADAAEPMQIDAFSDVAPQAANPDLDGDGFVDGADLGLLLGAWGLPGPEDLNFDGIVDGADLGLLLGAWT